MIDEKKSKAEAHHTGGCTKMAMQKFEDLLKNFSALGDRSAVEPVCKADARTLAEFEKLLMSFDRLPKAEKKPFTTLLEIAKFPHSELACSNIFGILPGSG